ncbi:MAG TPA: hypothetical protein VN442_00750 [Bryobacteraceae bacterium]|nr:hypothetical protein [Bryobacteraceae bacterium]
MPADLNGDGELGLRQRIRRDLPVDTGRNDAFGGEATHPKPFVDGGCGPGFGQGRAPF